MTLVDSCTILISASVLTSTEPLRGVKVTPWSTIATNVSSSVSMKMLKVAVVFS